VNRETRDRADAIIFAVCAEWDIPVSFLLSKDTRDARTVKVRWTACAALKKWLPLTTIAIGNLIARDHSTVVHALKQGARMPWMLEKLEAVARRIPFAMTAIKPLDTPYGLELYGDKGMIDVY